MHREMNKKQPRKKSRRHKRLMEESLFMCVEDTEDVVFRIILFIMTVLFTSSLLIHYYDVSLIQKNMIPSGLDDSHMRFAVHDNVMAARVHQNTSYTRIYHEKSEETPWSVTVLSKMIEWLFWFTGLGDEARVFDRATFEKLNPGLPATYPHYSQGVRTADFVITPQHWCSSNKSDNCDGLSTLLPHSTIPQRLGFRLFEPEDVDPSARLPVLVWVHGGGFNIGHPQDAEQDAVCRRFASMGKMIVLSVDYRLAPEHPYPASIHDLIYFMHWLNARSTRPLQMDKTTIFMKMPFHRMDLSRLFIGGDSAGANIASVTTLYLRDNPLPHLRVVYQLLCCPTFALVDTPSKRFFQHGPLLSDSLQRYFFKNYAGGNYSILYDPYVNPLFSPKGLRGLPPAYLVVAGQDPLQDDAYIYLEQLQQDGQHGVLARYDHMMHGFFTMSFFDEALLAMQHLLSHLRHAHIL